MTLNIICSIELTFTATGLLGEAWFLGLFHIPNRTTCKYLSVMGYGQKDLAVRVLMSKRFFFQSGLVEQACLFLSMLEARGEGFKATCLHPYGVAWNK